jgi:hypothetical protein
MRLRPEVATEDAEGRLFEVLRAEGVQPRYMGMVDRVEVAAYEEDDAMTVLSGSRDRTLLEASEVLRGLSRETFVHYRAIFPPEIRDRVAEALEELR